MSSSSSSQPLACEIGLRDGIALVAGTMIGSGIFLVPAAIAQQVPSLCTVLLVWIVGAALALAGALAFSELGAMFPSAGGVYVYLRETFGAPLAFLYGWTSFIAIDTGAIAALSAAFAIYLGQFLDLSSTQRKVASIVLIIALTAANIIGVKFGKYIQNFLAVCKFGGLAAMSVLLLTHANTVQIKHSFWPADAHTSVSAFGVALLASMWAYFGWHNASYSTGEFKNPQRDLPPALVIGTLVVTGAYLLANIAYYAVLSTQQVAQADRVAAVALGTVLGSKAASLLAGLIIISVIGAANGLIMTSPRIPYAMAADGLLPQALARSNSQTKTPIISIALQGCWAIVLSLVGTFGDLIAYAVFSACFFFAMTALGVIKLRRSQPERHRPFRSPGYPVVPVVFALANYAIIVNTFVTTPKGACIGAGLVLLGIPVYFVFRGIVDKPAIAEVTAD